MADYANVSAVKDYLRLTGKTEDAILARCATRASALIDAHCGRWFAPISETRTYKSAGSHITGRLLLLDADLLSVRCITGGDGVPIDPACYILRPVNWPPYFGVSLRQSSGLRWGSLGEADGQISVTGTWGYATTVPEPVAQAAIQLAAWLYRQRVPGMDQLPHQATERGASELQASLPQGVRQLLGPYVRLRISVYSGRD